MTRTRLPGSLEELDRLEQPQGSAAPADPNAFEGEAQATDPQVFAREVAALLSEVEATRPALARLLMNERNSLQHNAWQVWLPSEMARDQVLREQGNLLASLRKRCQNPSLVLQINIDPEMAQKRPADAPPTSQEVLNDFVQRYPNLPGFLRELGVDA